MIRSGVNGRAARRWCVLAAAAMPMVLSAAAWAQSFSNITPITLPTNSATGAGQPYGTSITVSGLSTRIRSFTVTIQNINHIAVGDVRALLVAPSGDKILLVSDAGSTTQVVGQTWTFSNEAATQLPTAFGVAPTSGTYRPTVVSGSALPAPAPGLPYTTDMSTLYGKDPNGTWTLYIADGFPNFAGGTIQGGWVLNIVGDVDTRFTYQGVLTSNNTPFTGNMNVRFSLFGAPFASIGETPLAPSQTKSFTNVQRGLVSTELNFGDAILTPSSLWLETAVESPIGSGFVTLSPRQAITIAPQAGRALVAASAERAPWSGLTGVPARVASPVTAYTNSVGSFTPATYGSTTYVTINQTNVDRAFPAGRVLVNWSITGFTNIGNTAVNIRPRLGPFIGTPTRFFFNTAGEHVTISGTSIFENVTAGTHTALLEVQRTFGTDALRLDSQDSFTSTWLSLPN